MLNFFFDKTKNKASTSRLKTVSIEETYGRHILEKSIKGLVFEKVLDIGVGEGKDLETVHKLFPSCSAHGIDIKKTHFPTLKKAKVHVKQLNIECQKLPFNNNTFDLIIANQVLEHTKELFWINHEVFRTLKVGGIFFIGVPNGLAFHNRLLGNFGMHPTCSKSISAHVRTFSKNDIFSFYTFIGEKFCKVDSFFGSQFYPFPKKISRVLANLFPSYATSIFFTVKKTSEYSHEFLDHVLDAQLDTNFFLGNKIR